MKNQLLNLKMIALMCLMMVLGGANVWAEVLAETFDFKVDHKISESQPYTDGDVTFTFTKGTSNVLFYQKKDPSLRLYYGATMTISVPEGGEISSIALTYYQNAADNKVTANVGSYSPNEGTSYKTSTWTGTASSVKFTVGGKSGHIRLQTVKVSYSLSNKTKTILSFGSYDKNTIVVNSGEEESFVAPTVSVKAGESSLVNPVITYKSENSAVADVASDGTITFGSEYGTTKITANYAGDDTYAASTSYYIINYKKTLDASVIFYESFDENDGTGGNDGQWSGSIATNDLNLDNSEWRILNGKGASKCAKIGSSSKGTATTPSIDLSAGDAVLAFKAGAWDGKSEMTSIIVSVDNGKLAYNGKVASEQTITLKKGEFSDYTMTISGGTSATKITFTAIQDKNNRFFLDEVMVSKVAAAEPTYTEQTPVTFRAEDNGNYYATFSNDKVTFITSDNSEAYKIVVSDGNIIKTKFDEVSADINGETVKGFYIPANTGVLLYSIAKTADYYTVENKSVDAISPVDNMLEPAPKDGGVFAFNEAYKYYKLAYNDYKAQTGLGFYWGANNGGAFYVKGGTAYLKVLAATTVGAKGFTLNGEATGIEGVNANVENAKAIYNLNGQRVASMAKPGLYIVNGKKVVRK